MIMDKDVIISKVAEILSDNLGQRLTVALATGVVNLLGQELNKESPPVLDKVEAE